MKPRLVVSLFGSMFVGLLTGVLAVAAGWGPIAGFLVYSLSGSIALVGLCVALPERVPAVRGDAGAGLVPAPQST